MATRSESVSVLDLVQDGGYTHPAFMQLEGDTLVEDCVKEASDKLLLGTDMPYIKPLTMQEFAVAAWEINEPTQPYIHNWHIDAICDHLMACTRYEIRRLVINIPPGHMKSLLCCVLWPAYVWAEIDPSFRFIFSSYERNLALRDSRKTRNIILSPWYQSRYGHKVALKPDNSGVQLFEDTQTGFRMATSPKGSGTGNRANAIVTDDCIKASDILSQTIRESRNDWWLKEMSNRGLGKKSIHIVIGQRLHTKDLPGVCKDRGYEALILPAEYEPAKQYFTSIGFKDPRTKPGEILFEELYDRQFLEEQKIDLGSYAYQAQYQQDPIPLEGGIVNIDWFKYRGTIEETRHKVYLSIDTANKGKNLNAFSVIQTWLVYKNYYLLVDVWRSRCDQPALKRRVKEIGVKWKPNAILIEDKASGTGLIQYLNEETRFTIIPIMPKGDKLSRIQSESPAIEAGKVYLLEDSPWIPDFLLELGALPLVDYFDQTDATSQFLRWIREKGQVSGWQLMKSRR